MPGCLFSICCHSDSFNFRSDESSLSHRPHNHCCFFFFNNELVFNHCTIMLQANEFGGTSPNTVQGKFLNAI